MVHPAFIIIPCYNRRETTLRCLRRLGAIGVMDNFTVVVVDDGSTDGTAEAVRLEFPQVHLLVTPGDLYWTGATEFGMRHAYDQGAGVFIWLNDDTKVSAGAIEAVARRAAEIGGIASGQGRVIIEEQNYEWYFPLIFRGPTRLRMVETDRSQPEYDAETCRGNLVAISRNVVDAIGYPDGRRMPHFSGDTDYGLRATRAGLPLKVLTHATVTEEEIVRTDNISWLLGEVPLGKLWRNVFQKRNCLYPPMCLTYGYRHWGLRGLALAVFKYVKLVAISMLRVLPRNLRIRMFGRHSNAWQALTPMRAMEEGKQ